MAHPFAFFAKRAGSAAAGDAKFRCIVGDPAYESYGEGKRFELENLVPILNDKHEETLAATDEGIRAR